MNEGDPRLSLDDALELLAHPRRRKLLTALMEHNPQEAMADRQPEVESNEATRVLEMRHVHLPKLTEAGLIHWDESTDEISKGPAFEELRPFLLLLDDHEDLLPGDWIGASA